MVFRVTTREMRKKKLIVGIRFWIFIPRAKKTTKRKSLMRPPTMIEYTLKSIEIHVDSQWVLRSNKIYCGTRIKKTCNADWNRIRRDRCRTRCKICVYRLFQRYSVGVFILIRSDLEFFLKKKKLNNSIVKEYIYLCMYWIHMV